jgi:uncharacterized membrane protein YkgB
MGGKPNRKVLCKTMNVLAAILAILAIITFSGAWQGHKYGTLGAGLALLTISYMVQLIWTTGPKITL